jgi:hypothetical protein
MDDKLKKHYYNTRYLPYVREVYGKMLPTKNYILPYIKDKSVVDWGSGPGHRAKILSSWGADSVQCWDINNWCRYVFNQYYSSNQLTWIDNFENINCDTLYIAGVTMHAGPDPHKWFQDILSKVNCKYVVATWDIENTEENLERILYKYQQQWAYFNTLGFNTQVTAYDIFTQNRSIEPFLFKEFPCDSKYAKSIKLLIYASS